VLAPQIRDTTNDKIPFEPVTHAWSLAALEAALDRSISEGM